MRILHVIENLDPANGGPQVVVTRMAAAQAALGHDVTIACYEVPGAGERIAALVSSVPGQTRVRRLELPPPGRWERLVPRGARRTLDPAVAASDVVHLHGVWESLLRGAADRARARGVPYLVTPHSLLDPWALAQKRAKKRVALAMGYRAMLAKASFIHVLNESEQSGVRLLGLTTRTVIVANGVFPEEFARLPPADAFADARPALRGRRYVLFLSRLHYKKGLDYLADAFAQVAPKFDDVDLVVAGPAGGAEGDFAGRVERHGLRDRVHVVGPLWGEAKGAALAGASCFCLPSRMEGFSIAVVEALACGVPVVISEECRFPEVQRAGAGVVVKLDAGAVAAGLASVLADRDAKSTMGRAGRALVEADYTWPRIAQRMVDAYAGAARRPAAGTAA